MGCRVLAHTLHARRLVCLLILVVELVAVPVPLFDQRLLAVCLVHPAAFRELAVVGPQPHRAAHVRHRLLLLHQVDDGVLGVCRHLAAVGILVAQHIPCKLNDHHLHAQADAEGWDVVCASIFGSNDLSLNAPLPEPRTDQHSCHAVQQCGGIACRQLLAVDEMNLGLHVVVDASQVQTLADALVGILQVVLAHQCNVHLTGSLALLVQKVVPGLHGRCLTYRYARLAQDGSIQSLLLHAHRHLVDARHVLALHHTLQVDIAERGHLHAQVVVQVALRA